MKPTAFLRRFLAIAGSAVLAAPLVNAATLYWDGGTVNIGTNGNGVSLGTAGNWDATLTNWDQGNGLAHIAWNNSNNDTALFGGTAGTVTLTAPITVGGLSFYTGSGYIINAGSQGLTFGGTNNTISFINPNGSTSSASIQGTVGGTGNVILTSTAADISSTLTFGGTSTGGWSGTTTINAGMRLEMTGDAANQVLLNTSAITLNGGTIAIGNGTTGINSANATRNRINDSAGISVNGGGTIVYSANNSSANAETVGTVTLNGGLFQLVEDYALSSGSSIFTFSGLSRTGATNTSAVNLQMKNTALSTGSFHRVVVGGIAANTPAGEIVGPWFTTTYANQGNADYIVYSNGGSGSTYYAIGANIGATAENTWSTTHAATSNYTLTNTTNGTNGLLTATRNVNSVKTSNTATTLTSVASNVLTVTGTTFANNTAVQIGGTAPTGLANNTVYYVVNNPEGDATFQLASTPGGTPLAISGTVTAANIAAGITLSSGNNLGTYGILNSGAAFLPIGTGTAGGVVTLPTTTSGNLYVTPAIGGIGINAPIQNNGAGVLTLVKNGSGGLFLTGTNTYTGGTVLNAGTLTIGNVNNIGGAGASLTFGGTATLAPSAALNFSTGTLNVNAGAYGTITGNATTTFQTTTGSGTLRYTSGASSGILNLGNASGFTGNLEFRLTGNANYGAGAATIQFSNLGDGGVLQVGGGQSDGTFPGQRVGIVFNGGASLTFNQRVIELLPRTGSGHTVNTTTLYNNSATANIWTINTNLSNLNVDARSFELAGTNTGNNAFNGVIGDGNTGGTINFRKDGTGTWTLGGANTYTGTTTVNAGTLRAGVASVANVSGAFGNNSAVTMANTAGATLALNGFNTQIGSLTGGGTTGGHVTLGAATLTVGGNNSSPAAYAGNISGSGGSLSKIGSGILALSGTNSYSGGTSVTTGTLTFLNTNAKSSTGTHAFGASTTLGLGVATSGSFFTSTDLDNAFAGTMTGNLSNVTVDATTNIGIDTTQAAFSYASNIGSVSRGLVKLGSNALTLSGNNSYTGGTTLIGGTLTVASNTAIPNTGTIAINGGTIQSNDATARSFTNAVTIGGDFTVGGTGNLTFSNTGASALGATRTITVTNSGVNATFGQAFSGGGITKAGAGTVTLTGNSSLGAITSNAGLLTFNGGSSTNTSIALTGGGVSIINGATLSTTSGGAATAFSTNGSMTVTGGSGVTSTWNLNGGELGNPNNSTFSNVQMLIDGQGYVGSARVINVGILNWGKSFRNTTITLTNGGQMNVNGEIRIGNPYYDSIGNNDIIIGGGTAISTFTGNNQAFYVGYIERNPSNNNDVIVNNNGVLTGIGSMLVGNTANGADQGDSTNNSLKVNGTGTASMASISIGNAAINVDAANFNLLQVTTGGTLTTTSGTNNVGNASAAGATANSNTATVTDSGSTWNVNGQNIIVGNASNATATANNNVLTVSSGGALNNVGTLTVGSGAGTRTGNQVVVNGGTLTAAALTVNAGNTVSVSGTNGLMTVNGAFSGGGSATITGGRLTVTGSGTKNLATTINGGDLRYNGSTNYTGTLTYTSGTISGTNWNGSLSGLTIGANQTISPGNSPGTASTVTQTWAGGGTYVWEINNATGTKGVDPGWDWLNATDTNPGSLNITATSGSKFNINITGLNTGNTSGAVSNWNPFSSGSWIIASASGAGGSVTGFDANAFNLVTTNFTNNNDLGGGNFTITQPGTDVVLNFNATATTAYWDINGATAGAGGATPSGTWSASAANWSTSSAGTAVSTYGWVNSGLDAVFSAGSDATGSYTVTLSGGVSAHNITFKDGAANVTSGTLTLIGSTPTVTVDSASAQISSVVDGTAGLTKAGTGTLTLTDTNTYSGATNVTSGTLAVSGTGSINNSTSLTVSSGATFRYNSSVALTVATITNSGTIAGTGNLVGITLGGTGSVDPGNSPGILTASATDPSGGLDYNFEMTVGNTLPTWSNAGASVNDVLRLTGGTPFSSSMTAANVISVYFGSGVIPTNGDIFTGGFYTDNNAAFLSAISSATFQYFVYNGVSGTLYNGTYYDVYSGPSINVSTVAQSADFGGGTINGYVTQFTVIPEPGAAFIGSLGLLALLRRRR